MVDHARFCMKGGSVYWSRSPNAADVDMTQEAPFRGFTLMVGALRAIMLAHARATRSGGKDRRGFLADLRGAHLDPECKTLVAAKLRDPDAKVRKAWSDVLERAKLPAPTPAPSPASGQTVIVGTATERTPR